VNRDVTSAAFPARLEAEFAVRYRGLGVETGMTLQAKCAALSSHEKVPIDAAVRIVTSHAATCDAGWMFVQERTALLVMTSFTRLGRIADQACGIRSAVRIVAIRTLHQTFRNPVMYRQCKLRLYRSVAGIAKCRLRRFQQAVLQPLRLGRRGVDLKNLRLHRLVGAFA